jgi:hypothetical protein
MLCDEVPESWMTPIVRPRGTRTRAFASRFPAARAARVCAGVPAQMYPPTATASCRAGLAIPELAKSAATSVMDALRTADNVTLGLTRRDRSFAIRML